MSKINEVLTDVVLKINSDLVLTTYKVKGITGFSTVGIAEFIVKAALRPGAIYAFWVEDSPDPDADNTFNGRVIQIKPQVDVYVGIQDRNEVGSIGDTTLSYINDLVKNTMYNPDNGASSNAGWDYGGTRAISFSQPAGITAIAIKFKRNSSFIYPDF